MRNDTHTYPTYKLCSIPQICQIPSHWEVKRLAQMGTFSKGGGGTKDDEAEHGLPCIRYGDIYTSHKYFATQSRSRIHPDRTPNYARIKYGDVLFAGSGETIEDIGKSVVSLIEEEAYCGGDVILFRPTVQVHPRFMGYTLDSPPFAFRKSSMGRGITIMHIYSSQLKNMCIPLPPLDEQAAIVRYLDHANELINRYISAKERLIALLEEQRQAVIHQAVTRGLDPTVTTKQSGIPELGAVPRHWRITQLGRLGTFSKGSGGTKDDEVACGLPCVRYGDIYTSHKYFVQRTRSFVARHRAPDYAQMRYGDVLFTGSGETIEDIGKSVVNLICDEAYCGADVILFRANVETQPEFMGYLLDSPQIAHQKSCMGRGITIMHVYGSQLKYLWLALPPPAEQAQIARYLEEATTEVSNAIDRAQRQIDLMDEYRTRLIADVVTGQLDVRHYHPIPGTQ